MNPLVQFVVIVVGVFVLTALVWCLIEHDERSM